MRVTCLEHLAVFWALLLVSCILVVTVAVAGAATSSASADGQRHEIRDECQFTRYPSLCVQTLMGLGSSGSYQYTDTDMISALVNETLAESNLADTSSAGFSMLSSQLGPQSDDQKSHQSMISEDCESLMNLSVKRLHQSLAALKSSHSSIKTTSRHKEDIQTWLSAALTYQQACRDSSAAHGGHQTISAKMSRLAELTSNALSLANRIAAAGGTHNSTPRHRLSEASARRLLQASSAAAANAVVAKDGSGDYRTVGEAVHAAPGRGRFVIYVKSGVYKEKIRTNKDGITLIGDGKYSTIITGDDSVAGGSTMPGSATFTVTGDGFIARDIGFENTAGPQGKQALALYIASDRSALFRCSIAGYQDTLYALALRQFYRECDIYGTVDFIFGNAAAVFQNCNLGLRRPRHGGSNVILANGRSDPGQNTGFSVQNCKITASSEFSAVKHSVKSYLGRPWKAYSRAVVMQSNIDDSIAPRGWIEWPGYGSSVLSSLYFAEYANVGPGAGTGQRVKWPGYRIIGVNEARRFTVANFIGGNSWLPSTRVAYDSGL